MKLRKPIPRKPNKVEIPKTVYSRKREKQRKAIDVCPKCKAPLYHFSGLEDCPEHLFCPICDDTAYDYDGSVLFKLV